VEEDHLRALRAVRLAAKRGFEIEPGTRAAITTHASELSGVSRERIGDEVRRMLARPARARAVSIMNRLGLDGPVLMGSCAGSSGRVTTLARLDEGKRQPSLGLCLAAWALDRTGGWRRGAERQLSETVDRWRKALCLSNEERAELGAAVEMLGLIDRDWAGMGVAKRKRGAAGAGFSHAMTILAIEAPAMAAKVGADVRLLEATPSGIAPTPLVTGDDLIAAGVPPGPAYKAILDGAYDAQLEDQVTTREEGLKLALSLARKGGARGEGNPMSGC
jgi:hypothetical protein